MKSFTILVLFGILCLQAGGGQEEDELHVAKKLDKGDEDHFEDPVDKILRQRGLKQPHEVRSRPGRDGWTDGDYESDKSINCDSATHQIKNLQHDLKECNEKQEEYFQYFIQNSVNESVTQMTVDSPFLKQIYRGFLNAANQSGQNGSFLTKLVFEVNVVTIEKMQKCINDDTEAHDCVKALISVFKTGQTTSPKNALSDFLDVMEKINFLYLIYFIISALTLFAVLYSAKILISTNRTVLGMIVIIFCLAFVVSVPWEWMRMYKSALSKKMEAKVSTSMECFADKMSYVSLLKWWLRDTFSFSDSPCLKYYDAVIVDPFWEVTPGEAIASATSNIVLHPLLILSEHLAKCFRIVFKEIPAQWQHLVFFSLVIAFLFAIGIQIYTPILRIGRGDNNRERLAFMLEENKTLKDRIGQLENQLLPIPGNVGQGRGVIDDEPHLRNGYGVGRGWNNGEAVEDLLQDNQRYDGERGIVKRGAPEDVHQQNGFGAGGMMDRGEDENARQQHDAREFARCRNDRRAVEEVEENNGNENARGEAQGPPADREGVAEDPREDNRPQAAENEDVPILTGPASIASVG